MTGLPLPCRQRWHAQHQRFTAIKQLHPGVVQLGHRRCCGFRRQLDLLEHRFHIRRFELIAAITALPFQLDLGAAGEIEPGPQGETDLGIRPAEDDAEQAEQENDRGHDPDLSSTACEWKTKRTLVSA